MATNHTILPQANVSRLRGIRGLAAIHLAVFLFGLSGLLGKMLTTTPVVIVFSRALVAAIVLSPALWSWVRSPETKRPQAQFLVLSGGILAIHWLSFFTAVQVSTVAVG